METLGEIGGRREAHHIAYLRNTQVVGFGKQVGGHPEARGTQELVGRSARQRLDARKKERAADIHGCGDVLDRKVRIGDVVHDILVHLRHETVARRARRIPVHDQVGHLREFQAQPAPNVDKCPDLAVEVIHRQRLFEVGVGTRLQRTHLRRRRGVHRNQHHGEVIQRRVVADRRAERHAVHPFHRHVAHDGRDAPASEQVERLPPVRRTMDRIAAGEMPHEKVREIGIILGQQDVGQPLLHLGLHGRHGRLPGRHSGIAIRPGDGTGCTERNRHRKLRPLSHGTFDPEHGAHPGRQALRHGEPQPQPAARDTLVGRIERFEYPCLLRPVYPRAVVADTHPEHIAGHLPAGAFERHVDAALGELVGITEYLAHDLREVVAAHLGRNGFAGQPEVHRDTPPRDGIPHRRDHRPQYFPYVDALRNAGGGMLALLRAFQVQDLVDQRPQPLAVLADDVHVVAEPGQIPGALGDLLDGCGNQRDGRTYFVGHLREEADLGLEQVELVLAGDRGDLLAVRAADPAAQPQAAARHGQQSQHAVGHNHGASHPPRRQHEDLDHGLLAELLAAGRGAHDEAVTVRRQIGVGDMLHPGPFVQTGGDPFVVEILQPVTVDRPQRRGEVERNEIEAERHLPSAQAHRALAVDGIGQQSSVHGHAAVEELEIGEDDAELGRILAAREIIGIELVDAVVAADVDMPGRGLDARIGIEDIGQQSVVGGELVDRLRAVPGAVFQQPAVGREPQFAAVLHDLEHGAVAVGQHVELPGERVGRDVVTAKPAAVGADPQVVPLDGQAAHEIGKPAPGIVRTEGEPAVVEPVADQPLAQRREPQVPAGILADVHHVAVMSQAECARDGLRNVVVTADAHFGADPQLPPRIAENRIDVEIVESRAGLREVLHLPRAQVDTVKPVAIRPDPQPSAVDGERMDVERPVARVDRHGRIAARTRVVKAQPPVVAADPDIPLGILAEFADDMPAPLAGLDEREKRTERREVVDAAEIGSDPHAAVTILEDGVDEFVVEPSVPVGRAVVDMLETAVLGIEIHQAVIRPEHDYPRGVFDHAPHAAIRLAVLRAVAGERQPRKFELVELAGIPRDPDVAEGILAHGTDTRDRLARERVLDPEGRKTVVLGVVAAQQRTAARSHPDVVVVVEHDFHDDVGRERFGVFRGVIVFERAALEAVTVEAVAERPDPHVARDVRRKRIDQQVAALPAIAAQDGQVDERLVLRVENIDPVAGSDPYAVAVGEPFAAKTVNTVVFERIAAAVIGAVVGEIVGVEPVEAVGRADPDIPLVILVEALDGIRRQPAVVGIIPEFVLHTVPCTQHQTHHDRTYRTFHPRFHSADLLENVIILVISSRKSRRNLSRGGSIR